MTETRYKTAYVVFLASPKDSLPSEVDEAYIDVLQRFEKGIPFAAVMVVRAEDDYKENFARCGGWSEWTRDVGAGLNYEDRTPRFNAIACTTQDIGRATAQIVEAGLEARRMVVCRVDGKLRQVAGVETVDSENWKSGWRLTLTP